MPPTDSPAVPSDPIDLLALGALVVRWDSGVVPVASADLYRLHVSGGEYNVAADLARCFGLRTAVASAIVDSPLGRRVEAAVREAGVEGLYVRFRHDGVRGPNIAEVWCDRGFGLRQPTVFYNRANEAAALLGPGSFDWPLLLRRGVRCLHSGGIFAALSETTPALILEAFREARAHGTMTSFDLNLRPPLWNTPAGTGRARTVLGDLVRETDILFGNSKDLAEGLGLDPPRCPAPQEILRTFRDLRRLCPHLRACGLTFRQVLSSRRHLWSAALATDGKVLLTSELDLEVYDRVGSGDAFAAGVLFGLLTGRTAEESLRLGWAHGALVATTPGDTSPLSPDEVTRLAQTCILTGGTP